MRRMTVVGAGLAALASMSSIFAGDLASNRPRRRKGNKYTPHQGPRECARRLRQMPWLASVGPEGWQE